MLPRPSQESLERLNHAATRSQRSSGIRLPPAFVRDRTGEVPSPPLAAMVRGGGIQLQVYLTVLMMATKPPHAVKVSSTHLAEMLGFLNPAGAGARRASKALRDLEAQGLVEVDRKPGYVPETKVLNPGGSREDWNDRLLDRPYISLPIGLWHGGWLLALSTRALAILIVLRDVTAGRKNGAGWVDGIRKRQYGLSDDTWTRGCAELQAAGLLEIDEQTYSSRGEPRRRNVYTLNLGRLTTDPWGAPRKPLRSRRPGRRS